jgi:hypothetical protein
MSDEEEPRPRGMFEALFSAPTPEQMKEVRKQRLERHKAMIGFARAASPIVKQMQEKARELDSLYSAGFESGLDPLRGVMDRNRRIRKQIALLLDTLEGLAEG